jgi:amidase
VRENDIVFAPASELARRIRGRELSALDVVEMHLAQIARHNGRLNAIVTLDADGARRRATDADAALARGTSWGPLHGVPVTLKDVHDVGGMRSTLCHPAFADRVAPCDGAVASRLRGAGAIVLGKTNFQHYPGNPFGDTWNPWDPTRTTGGSSAGSAAAVAAGLSPLDIGSDLGGSITVPGHCCGVYAMRPTERRVPVGRYATDITRLWRVILVYGPLARSVEDLRLALSVIAGPDDLDPEVPPIPWRDVPPAAVAGLRVAWTDAFPNARVAADVGAAVERFAAELARHGARVTRALPDANLWKEVQVWSRLVYEMLLPSAVRPPKRALASVAEYLEALEQRDAFIGVWERFLADYDVFLSPAFGVTAWPAAGPGPSNDESLPAPLSAATGHPAVVLPLAQDGRGLPIGMQLIGRRWDDERLLAIADALAALTPGFRPPPACSATA